MDNKNEKLIIIILIVSSEIEKQLNIKFENFEFKLDNWGEVDNYAIIEKHIRFFRM